MQKNWKLHEKRVKAAGNAALASVGLSWDKLIDLSEDYAHWTTGDTDAMDRKEEVKKAIRRLETEEAQEVADDAYEENEISKERYETISRQIRIAEDES